jgi:Tfp pilus assembly protein PilO
MIKSFLLPLLLIGTAIGLVLMYTLPQYEVLQRKLLEKSAYESALAQAAEILSLKEDLRIQYDSFSQEDRVKLQKMLPDKPDMIGSILETDDVASQNGVVVTSIEDMPATESSGIVSRDELRTVGAAYGVVSNYESFLNFLRGLERSLRITDVTSLSFGSDTEDLESNLIDFSLETSTYWLSE